MPGTMTRLTRARNSGSTGPLGRAETTSGVLADKHVVLIGADSSPYVTGFPHFTSALREVLEERAGRVSLPLETSKITGRPVDLVVAVLPGPGSAGAAVEVADRHGAPLLVLAQGETHPPEAEASTTGARLAARLESAALRRADRVGVLSEAARHRLVRLGVPGDRIESFSYWARQSPPAPEGSFSHRARVELGWAPGFTVVCPVGADPSGLPVVVEAASALAGRRSDIRLVLAGRGRRLQAQRESVAAAPNIVIAELTDDEYGAALAAADVVLLAEGAETVDAAGAGRLAAALAAGRPVVAVVAEGGHLHDDLVRAGGAVVIVPPAGGSSARQLADALEELRGAPRARVVMAASARHYTRACLGPAAAAGALESIASRALTRPGRPQ